MDKPILDPSVPYIGPVFGGKFEPGKLVRVQGTIPSVAYRFDVNLQCGPETSPRDDVAVQISVHILDGYISLNSLEHGVWGEEQRHLLVPVKRAERFEIILMCDYDQYKIAINGQHYCEFPQRIHYSGISHLSIDGDVSIIQISYETTTLPSNNASGLKTEDDDFVMVEGNSTKVPLYTPAYNNQPLNAYTPVIPGSAPYPPGGIPNVAPYPTVPVVNNASGPPGFPPPPVGAPIPLNACSSNFRTVKRTKSAKCWRYVGGVVGGIITVIIIVVVRKLIRGYFK